MPPPYPTSIVGQFVVGDGHVVGGHLIQTPGGVPSKASFGTVTATALAPPQTKAVGAVPSKAAFGTPVPFAAGNLVSVSGLPQGANRFGVPVVQAGALARQVGSVASAQSFGAIKANQGKTSGGVNSGQAFGTPIILPKITRQVGAVASAASFGTPAAKSVTTRLVTGAPSAQAFGTPLTKIGKLVGGVNSAQAFGAPTPVFPPQFVPVPGLEHGPKWTIVNEFLVGQRVVGWYGGENLWGTPVPLPGPVSRTLTGIPTAQQFGTVKVVQIAHPAGVPSKQAFGTVTPIAGPVWIPVLGIRSAQQFGEPLAYRVWLYPPPLPDEITLVPVPCDDAILAPVACADATFVPVAWTEETLVRSADEELVLVPSVEE